MARNVTAGFSGVEAVVNRGQIPRDASRGLPTLNIASAPLFTGPDEAASIEVRYEDRYGTPSFLTIPVARQKRADGDYNPVVRWEDARTRHIKPSWRTRVRIGREH